MGTLVKPGARKHCSWMGVAGVGDLESCTQTTGMHDYHCDMDDYRGHGTAVGDIWPCGRHDSYVLGIAPYLLLSQECSRPWEVPAQIQPSGGSQGPPGMASP